MLLLFREQTSSQSFPDLGIPKMSQKLRPLVLPALRQRASHIAAVDVTPLTEPFEKSRRERSITLGSGGIEEANHRHRALLCARGERQRRRHATEKRDELASLHGQPLP